MNNIFNGVLRQTARSVRVISMTPRHSGRLWAQGARWMCSSSSEEVKKNLEQMVKKDKVVVFIKGTPEQPMCGFSNAVVQILRMHGVEDYTAHNVLENQELREAVKTFSNWPTIPQVFFNGEFVGDVTFYYRCIRAETWWRNWTNWASDQHCSTITPLPSK